MAKESTSKEPLVKVKVLAGAVGEGDQTFLKGETFDTTAKRAAELADSVEIVK